MDSRLTPCNGRVADLSLQGQVRAARFLSGAARQVSVPLADLRHAPHGNRLRQLPLGADVALYETRDGWCFVQAARDGYVGYVRSEDIGATVGVTHCLSTLASHAYEAPDFKSPDRAFLGHGARLDVRSTDWSFADTPLGYVPLCHLSPITQAETAPLKLARLFLGVPYLWGGNGPQGLDCSGLVQAVLQACGLACPGDSDLQQAALPQAGDDQYRPGDLIFWKGHVALVSAPDLLIHANVHHMAVAHEPLQAAVARIAAQGDGPPTGHARPNWPNEVEL